MATRRDPATLNGTRLGSCVLEAPLGTGGMGAVYLARQERPHRKVAVKVLHQQLTSDPEAWRVFLQRFRREADATAALDHANIVPIFEFGEQQGVAYLVMPYLSDGSLAQVLDREGSLPLTRAVRYVEQIAAALDLAHRQGIVHRDVKPSNLLLHPDGRLMLADFGIARPLGGPDLIGPAPGDEHEDMKLTRAGATMGTPEYMAPEQARGEQAGPPSDIYALGIVAYEMLSGEPPFTAHIGIAMGGRGTDVAREAASLVLLDDDFASIVRAVRLGRRIYDNLRKAMSYILAIHVPIAGLALLPALLGWPLLMTPMLIALLELIIDPACSVILEAEPEERDVMRRPPRDPHSHLLSGALISWSMLQGVIALGAVITVVAMAFRRGMPPQEIRALGFVMLVGLNLALIFVNRTFSASLVQAFARPNRALGIGLAVLLVLLTAIFGWPAARGFFDLGSLGADDFATCATGLAIALLLLQVARFGWRGRLQA